MAEFIRLVSIEGEMGITIRHTFGDDFSNPRIPKHTFLLTRETPKKTFTITNSLNPVTVTLNVTMTANTAVGGISVTFDWGAEVTNGDTGSKQDRVDRYELFPGGAKHSNADFDFDGAHVDVNHDATNVSIE